MMREAAPALWTLAVLLSGCASQVPPSGGPPDTFPPRIIATSPADGTLGFTGSGVLVRFSEYVDRASFRESVFLSPAPGALRFDWSGDEVEIAFAESLKAGTTYIMTIGTDLKDTRNNALDSAFTVAFSTGDVIDSCSVSGKIFDENPGGVMVFSYLLGESGDVASPETLNPVLKGPDYLTQSSVDGSFRVSHMKPGRYRILCVRDVFKNLLYDIQTDAYGIPPGDVVLTPASRDVGRIFLRLTTQDTVGPFLSGARTIDNRHVRIRLSEPVDPASLTVPDIRMSDTLNGSILQVVDLSPADTSGREYAVTTVVQKAGIIYRIALRTLTDRAGNSATEDGLTVFVAGAGDPDTSAPVPLISVTADSVQNIHPRDPLSISFGESVDTASLAGGLKLTGGEGVSVPCTLEWRGRTALRCVPSVPFHPGEWYRFELVLDSLRDMAGNGYRDSVIVRHFRIMEERDLGSIAGVVTLSGTGPDFAPRGPVRVIAKNISLKASAQDTATADTSGRFLLGDLREGSYLLSAFEDRDSNGQFTFGLPYPVRFSERFSVFRDTVKVRPRWPVEGVRIDLPR